MAVCCSFLREINPKDVQSIKKRKRKKRSSVLTHSLIPHSALNTNAPNARHTRPESIANVRRNASTPLTSAMSKFAHFNFYKFQQKTDSDWLLSVGVYGATNNNGRKRKRKRHRVSLGLNNQWRARARALLLTPSNYRYTTHFHQVFLVRWSF